MFIQRLTYPNTAMRSYVFPYRLADSRQPHWRPGYTSRYTSGLKDDYFGVNAKLERLRKALDKNYEIEVIEVGDPADVLDIKMDDRYTNSAVWNQVEQCVVQAFCLEIKSVP